MLSQIGYLFLLVFLTTCEAQTQNNSLKKYSYHTVGMIENKPLVGGTGFFIKYNSRYYLVSAWHCFTFKNHLSETFENPALKNITSIIVYRNLADIGPDRFMRIKTKNIGIDNPMFFERRVNDTLLDISAIEIQRTSPFEFDYIDFNEIDTSDIKMNDSVAYNGFPIINGRQVDTAHLFAGTVVHVDKTKDEFIIKIEGYTGCSGSPVFRIKGKKIKLKGLLFYALKDNTGKASLCKAINIRQLLELLKNK